MSAFAQVKVRDSAGTVVDPAQAAQIDLLRRIVKLLESQGNMDSSGRQRVSCEGTLPTVTTVGTVTSMSQLSGFVSWTLLQDNANLQYRLAIRPKLSWWE